MYAVISEGLVVKVLGTEAEARVWLAESGLYRSGKAQVCYFS